ncbi:FAD binding domain-containing protein [Plastoroseomonas hellenica]|uniref:FAD binding domain-containing protein n=1 Tax=Plastoroseomonas hellenica TaxID=2687306 RepID=UPI001BA7D119|nr:xanthine dehydrogenase family protein subunit M [Plastoroseomonas hellenica]MBR0644378.1 xanthine dehydrogenase family protein subunit M [Plastoroseomonas hellenica]
MRPFHYAQPDSTAEALAAIGAGSAAADETRLPAPPQYLAGGTNLLDLMKIGVAQPPALVDLARLRREHGAIAADGNALKLGALARMAEAAEHPAVLRDYPVIAQSLRLAASQQLRNMATLGGNVLQRTRCSYFRDPSWSACNKRQPGSGCAAIKGVHRRLAVLGVSDHCIAHFPGDFAIALAALGATVELLAPGGERRSLDFEALHRLPGDTPDVETVLRPGELITGFTVPAGPWTRRSLYLKIRDRESYDFALASAAVALQIEGGVVRQARIGLGGLVAKPWRSHVAEAVLAGRPLDRATAEAAAEAAFVGAVTHRETEFKPELGRRTLVRALLEAARMEV